MSAFRKEIVALRQSRVGKGGGRKGGGKGKPDALRGRVYPKVLPKFAEAFSKEQFNALLPPGVWAHKEAYHGRWRIFWPAPDRKSRSASWDLHGSESAISTLLRDAWLDFTSRTGVECPFKLP